MEVKREISTIGEVQSFMKMIEPELENLLKMFYALKKHADGKKEINEIVVQLENQFDYTAELVKSFNSSNQHVSNFLNSIIDFSSRGGMKTTNMMSKKVSADFFELMSATEKGFEYGYWGKMNKRIQQGYLRIYSYYSKCNYELIKKEVEDGY
ncbi:hypothetical protein QWY85_17040 [Neolewinella lacunae]|nr:hypothetical protein [Neolewinella lacunae]MDN3636374.1 hypothetical protein [Neolewinella lacunae]